MIRRILPPSRQAFYDYSSKMMNQIAMQQNSINSLQNQLFEMQIQLNEQQKKGEELRWFSNELIKKYNDDKLWELHNLIVNLNKDDEKSNE